MILARARGRVKAWLLEMGVIGAIESKITGLALSSDHGMSDKHQVEHSGGQTISIVNYKPEDAE